MHELSKLYRTITVGSALLLMSGVAIGAREPHQNVRMGKTSNTISTHGPVRQCSDLKVSFEHGMRTAHAEQTLSFSRASAPVLRAHLAGPSGMTVSTGSGPDYSVTVCKYAAATYASSSGENLDQINVTAQNGEIQSKTPDDDNWMFYLIIHAPAGVAFDLSTHDGPLELGNLSGKITARVENGPLSIENCTGEVDASAVNGPLNVNGSSGRMHVRTENGPLSVTLGGNKWENGELEGSTSNGPLDLDVAKGYLSGVVVETDGNSPVSCHAAACSDAQRTWNDDSRRIEIGKQPVVVRLSTHNGPVSVNSKKSSDD